MKPLRWWTFTLLLGCSLLVALASLLAGMIYFGQKGSAGTGRAAGKWPERLVRLGAAAGYRITPPEKQRIDEGSGTALDSVRFNVYHEQALPGGSFLRVVYVPSLQEYRVDFVHGAALVFANFIYDPKSQEVQLRADKDSLADLEVDAPVADSPLTRRQVEEQIAAVFDLVRQAGGP